MKACPGLRSGIDRSGGLSFAIRGIPSPIRPPFVIPAKAGIQRGGEGYTQQTMEKTDPTSRDFHPLMRPSQGHGDSGEEPARYPDTGPEFRGGGGAAPMTPKRFQRPGLTFIPWCAGRSRHRRLLPYNNSRIRLTSNSVILPVPGGNSPWP